MIEVDGSTVYVFGHRDCAGSMSRSDVARAVLRLRRALGKARRLVGTTGGFFGPETEAGKGEWVTDGVAVAGFALGDKGDVKTALRVKSKIEAAIKEFEES